MNCVFCDIISKKAPAYIIYEDNEVVAFLDKYPQTRGHLQLIPKKHIRWLYELPTIGDFFVTAQRLIRVIIPVLEADHVTMATFGHLIAHAHLWIVPQYKTYSKIKEVQKKRGENLEELALQLRTKLTGGGVFS